MDRALSEWPIDHRSLYRTCQIAGNWSALNGLPRRLGRVEELSVAGCSGC